MAYPSQSQQHMALDEKTLSTSKTGDAMRANCPQPAEPVSEYTSLDPSVIAGFAHNEFRTYRFAQNENGFAQNNKGFAHK